MAKGNYQTYEEKKDSLKESIIKNTLLELEASIEYSMQKDKRKIWIRNNFNNLEPEEITLFKKETPKKGDGGYGCNYFRFSKYDVEQLNLRMPDFRVDVHGIIESSDNVKEKILALFERHFKTKIGNTYFNEYMPALISNMFFLDQERKFKEFEITDNDIQEQIKVHFTNKEMCDNVLKKL